MSGSDDASSDSSEATDSEKRLAWNRKSRNLRLVGILSPFLNLVLLLILLPFMDRFITIRLLVVFLHITLLTASVSLVVDSRNAGSPVLWVLAVISIILIVLTVRYSAPFMLAEKGARIGGAGIGLIIIVGYIMLFLLGTLLIYAVARWWILRRNKKKEEREPASTSLLERP